MSDQANKWLNANKIYDAYGIPRSKLREFAALGRIRCKVLDTECGRMYLYNVDDVDALINTAPEEGGAQ